MCGIIGILGADPAALRLVQALKLLEYRGYDSQASRRWKTARSRAAAPAGLQTWQPNESAPLAGVSGIGHTRWATAARDDRQRPPARDR
ncbi:MAG: hypothetical protein R3C30_16865 [Hyphomonadaceae bacterium]